MPTNLKTLLSRSRSRNELKLREKGDESPPGAEVSSESSSSGSNNVTGGSGGSGPGHVRGITTIATAGTVAAGGIDFSSSTSTTTTGRRKDAGCKSFFSCSALHGVGLVTGGGGGAGNGEGRCVCTPGQQNLVSSGKSDSSGSSSSSSNCSCYLPALGPSQREMRDSCGSLRKCETVLALSSFQGNHIGSLTASSSFTSSSSASDMRSMKGSRAGTPTETHSSSYSSSSSGRVKVMKDKIFSTSSSTLNNLIHSSSSTSSNRTRLFPSWKVASGATSTTTGAAAAGAAAAATTTPAAVNSPCSNSPLCCPNGNSNGTSVSPMSHLCHGGLMLMSGSNSRSQLSISENAPMTPVNRLRRNVSATNPHNTCFLHNSTLQSNTEPVYSRSSSVTSFSNWKEDHDSVSSVSSAASSEIFCRLCLSNYKVEDTCALDACSCRYCKDCLVAYVSFEIEEGAYDIACPDATCDKEGVLSLVEIEHLVPKSLMDKHRKFRLYREVEKDGQVMWCPTPGCETICMLQHVTSTSSSEETKVVLRPGLSRSSITCATCAKTFCAECKLSWHPEITCESHRRKLVKQGKLSVDDEEIYAIESIKKCPFCYVPIEKDSGCAQMMCKRCKHVFCWYCLASLDDDFLLRHYDKGPCKNKLGHSRASVVWHRAQVIGIFAGFGVLVLLASPLLILAAPCLLCCRCRYCANKLDPEDPVSL